MDADRDGRVTGGPTGRLEQREGASWLVVVRLLDAPVEEVWADLTESERLGRWFGTYTGDPASGSVTLRMNAEDGDPEEEVQVRECVPPRRVAITAHNGDDEWLIDVDLREEGGQTRLELAQRCSDPVVAEGAGPGWEYYLDRLVAARTGADPDAVDFERDYHPAMAGHYRALFG